jgi:hypothetical protein
MSDEAQAAAKDQERLKGGNNSIPQGGGEGGKKDSTASGGTGSDQGPSSDAAPNLKPNKSGDS